MGDFLGGNSPGGKCPAIVFWVRIFLKLENTMTNGMLRPLQHDKLSYNVVFVAGV